MQIAFGSNEFLYLTAMPLHKLMFQFRQWVHE